MLWEVLEKHKKVMQERDKAAGNIGNTWELVVVQTVILVILALIALMWGFCCRKQCFANNNDTVSVSEALRKLSKDLPPSYSMRDLHTLGISVDDHLHPPPAYLELFKDDLQYLDLEAGHSRMAKLSFCNGDQGKNLKSVCRRPERKSKNSYSNSMLRSITALLGPPRLARLSVASCATCSNESPVNNKTFVNLLQFVISRVCLQSHHLRLSSLLSASTIVVLRFRGVGARRQRRDQSLVRRRLRALAERRGSPSPRRSSAPTALFDDFPPTPGRARPPRARAVARAVWPQRCRRWVGSIDNFSVKTR